MGAVDRDLIKLTGARCPLTQRKLLSIRRLTDFAITRVHPRKPSRPANVGRSGRRRHGPGVPLGHHSCPAANPPILWASAPPATLRSLVASNLTSHESCLARLPDNTVIAPLTSSRRR